MREAEHGVHAETRTVTTRVAPWVRAPVRGRRGRGRGPSRRDAVALIEHNTTDALAACADGFVSLVTAAESTGEVRAGWLPEYTLHLTKTITMRVADFVARDPTNGVTCSCTVCT